MLPFRSFQPSSLCGCRTQGDCPWGSCGSALLFRPPRQPEALVLLPAPPAPPQRAPSGKSVATMSAHPGRAFPFFFFYFWFIYFLLLL